MDHIARIINQMDEDRLTRNLFYLCKDPLPFRKVNYTIPGHAQHTLDQTDAWITDQLRHYGYSVEREACQVRPFGRDTTKNIHHQYAPPPPDTPFFTAYNLYAQKTGRKWPDQIIVLIAHKDSQSWIDCPGAYDNGVGTVALIEMARLLANYENDRTIRFIFCNEEHTPWTSITAAQNARQRGDNIIAVFNIDGIGGKSDADIAAGRKTNVTRYTAPAGKPLADLMAEVNEAYHIGLVQTSFAATTPNDDDGSFIKAGYECAVANFGSFPYADAQYHLPGDVPERVDIENVRMAAQASLAAVLRLDMRK